jgi:hypothetical protein
MSDTPSPESVAPDSLDGVTVPDHVVFRVFAAETVVLNINTGQYHGLNPVAGRMLETLQAVGDFQAASEQLAAEFGQPQQRVESDLRSFCESLVGRGLVEIRDAGAP